MPPPRKAPRKAPRLTGRLEVSTELGSFLGDTRVRLLEAIGVHGSISQAAKHVPLSYKAAWDAVDANEQPGRPAAGGAHHRWPCRRRHGADRARPARGGDVPRRGGPSTSRRWTGWPGSLPMRQAAISAGLPAPAAAHVGAAPARATSFVGTVCGLREGPVDFEVLVRLDEGLELAAVVTRTSAEALGLAIGVRGDRAGQVPRRCCCSPTRPCASARATGCGARSAASCAGRSMPRSRWTWAPAAATPPWSRPNL